MATTLFTVIAEPNPWGCRGLLYRMTCRQQEVDCPLNESRLFWVTSYERLRIELYVF